MFASQQSAMGAAADEQPSDTAQRPGPFTTNVLSQSVRDTDPGGPNGGFDGQNRPYAIADRSAAPSLSGGSYRQRSPDAYSGYGGSSYPTYRTPGRPHSDRDAYRPAANAYGSGSLTSPMDVDQSFAADGSYVVQPNDNYWTISEKLYGTGAYFRALSEHNRKKNPDAEQLRPGEKIAAPEIAELEKNYRDLCPTREHRDVTEKRVTMASTVSSRGGGRVYVVQEGDTLFDIARYELGKPSRWAEVFELNRQVLGNQYDYLTPGMRLVLPIDRPTESLAERPGGGYRR